MKDKRAILGLDTVKAVMLALLGIAIISVIVFIVLDSLIDVDTSLSSTTVLDETTIPINETGYWLGNTSTTGGNTQGFANCVGTILGAGNATGTVIDSANYTITGCFLNLTTAGILGDNRNQTWRLNYSYTDNEDAHNIDRNISQGVTGFFGNLPTFFTLLAVVIIILIISIVIVAVNRFGTEQFSGGGGGSRREADF